MIAKMLIPLDPEDHTDSLVNIIVDVAVVLAAVIMFTGGLWLACEWAYPR